MRNVANLNPGLAEICRLHYYSLLNALALAVTPRLASSLLIGKATYIPTSQAFIITLVNVGPSKLGQ